MEILNDSIRRNSRKATPQTQKSFLQKFQDSKTVERRNSSRLDRSHSTVLDTSSTSSTSSRNISLRGRSSIKPAPGFSRPFHVNVDPNITLRQTEERLKLKDMKDWCNMSDLGDTEEADLAKYKKKLTQRIVSKGQDPSKLEIEEDISKLVKRQRDIDKVKVEQAYKDFLFQVPKDARTFVMPRTPCKFRVTSRRGWDSKIQRWKKHLHHWKEADYEPSLSSISQFSVSQCESDVSSVHEDQENQENISSKVTIIKSEVAFKSNPMVYDEESNTMQGETTTTITTSSSWRRSNNVVEDDDETTLQQCLVRTSSPKKSTKKRSSTMAKLDVENILHRIDDEEANLDFPKLGGGASAAGSVQTRQKTYNTRMSSSCKIEPDVLHSGLTNEMQVVSTWAKRVATIKQEPSKRSYGNDELPAMQSPQKKIRRSHTRNEK